MSTLNGRPVSFNVYLNNRLIGVAQSIPGDIVHVPASPPAVYSFGQKIKPTCHRKKVQIKRIRKFLDGMREQAEAMKPRYVLHPGWVVSKVDGDRHFITAKQLEVLYRVDPRNCVVYPAKGIGERFWEDRPGDAHLYPRSNGDYRLPESKVMP